MGKLITPMNLLDALVEIEKLRYQLEQYKTLLGTEPFNIQADITALQSYYEKNVLKELANKLSKTENDKAYGLITFLKGLNIGDGTNGIDSNGNATLNSIEIDDFVSKLSGGFFGKDINGNTYLETDKLYVRAKAYFENLEIIKTQYSYGNRIVGKGGIKVNNIEMLDINGNIITDELQCNAYRCYFLTEQEGIKIYNPFIVGDQAIAKEFNIAEGNNTHVANHYLWRAVVSVGENYIDLSKDICDVNSDAPIIGDELCQLGYRGDGNEDRTCAIMENIAGENVPSYIMLKGITDFSLSEKDILSMGYDNITGKAYFRVYGEAYIGDRGRSNFFEFADGKATFNGEAHFKAGTDGGENISGITSSTTNLILNSGFSGNFETKKLDDNTTLVEATQMYSPSLYGWDGNATVKADVESLSGFSATITESISQTISAGLSVNNVYSFTCKAKGSFVTIKIAGNEYPFTLNTEYETLKIYVSPILGNTIEISGDCEICEPMLVLGGVFALWQRSPLDNDKATGIQVALSYLSEALQNDTTINGGLLTSTIIKLGRKILGEWEEAAGMSGIYNDDNDVAFYAGGTFEQSIGTVIKYLSNPNYKPTAEELNTMAKFVVTHGGRAILNDVILRGIIYAEGGILKNIQTPNKSLKIDENGNIEIVGKFSSAFGGRKIEIDPEAGNIVMYETITENGIDIKRPLIFIDQTTLPRYEDLGQMPNISIRGYDANGEIKKNISISDLGILAETTDSYGDIYYTVTDTGINYNRVNSPEVGGQHFNFRLGIGEFEQGMNILDFYSTHWPTFEEASVGGIYVDNGVLKVKPNT